MSLILAVWPFLKPSVSELKRVSWAKKGDLLQNTAIVFAFVVIMAGFFLLSDYLLGFLLQFFDWLAWQNAAIRMIMENRSWYVVQIILRL